jgi:glycosyltransferase involved in cell wall biosynthesis
MITFIIPTLWRSTRIRETIESINKSDRKDVELIIIDNLNSDFSTNDPRVTVIRVKNNIYVNPAWNIGVTLAKNEYVCILNDDISLNVDCLLNNFEKFKEIDPDFGMIGLHEDNINGVSSINYDNDNLELEELDCRTFGFGCMMILKRSNYVQIPKVFKVFFGDDYLYYYNKDLKGRKIYKIKGLKTPGEVSITSKEFEDTHMQQEHVYWDNEIHNLNLTTKNK